MTNKNGCVLLISRKYDDAYAYPVAWSVDKADKASVLAFARDFASTLALDEDESLSVHLTDTCDPGRARLEFGLNGQGVIYASECRD